MKAVIRRYGLIIFLTALSLQVFPQHPERKGVLRSTITLEQLKKAITIEDLIDDLPGGYEVVFFRLGIGGKNLKDHEINLEKKRLNNTFELAQAGDTIFIEYIQLKKRGVTQSQFTCSPENW